MNKINCKDCEYFDLSTSYVSTDVHLCKRLGIGRYGDETCPEIGCDYCNPGSGDCHIFINPLDGHYYMEIETSEWDAYDDGFVTERIYIEYCPMCGRKL